MQHPERQAMDESVAREDGGRGTQYLGPRLAVPAGSQQLQGALVLPALVTLSLVLLPGETLPLPFRVGVLAALAETLRDEDVVALRDGGSGMTFKCPRYFFVVRKVPWAPADKPHVGAVMEIVSLSSAEDLSLATGQEPPPERPPRPGANTGEMLIGMVLKARCRARVASLEGFTGEPQLAEVSVLPDLGPLRSPSTVRERRAHVPAFAYGQFDALALSRKCATLGFRLLQPFHSDNSALPTVPDTREGASAFSYWVGRNLPIDNDERQRLLNEDLVVARLLRLIAILEGMAERLRCGTCGLVLSSTDSVVAMTPDGTAGTYMNEFGVIHQLLTVREMREDQVTLDGHAHEEHSYFPGYSWTIMKCACGAHLGWLFRALEQNRAPTTFFGLLREQLRATAQ